MEALLPGLSLLLVLLAAGWGNGVGAAWAMSPGGCKHVSPHSHSHCPSDLLILPYKPQAPPDLPSQILA